MKDYYKTLGIERTADATAIKQAYRRMASQYHPDKGGTKDQFQEIEEAYRILSDPTSRQQYDAQQHIGSSGAAFNFDDIFNMFGAQFRHQTRAARMQLWISIGDVAQGGHRILSVASPHGTTNVDIDLPAGLEDGDSIRYPGIAPGGLDLIVQFRVKPDPNWVRQGNNVQVETTLDMWDLILGTEVTIATLINQLLTITVPPNTQPGTVLRIKGHGLPIKNSSEKGDLLMRVNCRLPGNISPELIDLIRKERGY